MSTRRITISGFKWANHTGYRESLLGLHVAFTTPSGTLVEGVVTVHPMYEWDLAVTTPEGKWAKIGPNDVLTVLANA